MRRRAALLIAVLPLAGLGPVAGASDERAPEQPPAMVVSGQLRTPVSYLRSGLAPRQAAYLAMLDRLAHDGFSRSLLQHAADDATVSSSPALSGWESLTAGGDLDGRPGQEVLEERHVGGKGTSTVQLVARDGQTGRALWSRKDVLGAGVLQFAVPTTVRGRGGVLLVRSDFSDETNSMTLLALDSQGRQAWARRFTPPPPPEANGPGVGVGASMTFAYTSMYVEPDARLRPGAVDVLVTGTRFGESNENGVRSAAGALSYQAVSSADGAVRTVAGSVPSSKGMVSGGRAGDQDGDGLEELLTVDAGAGTVTARRARDGKTVWQRSDLALHGAAWGWEVGRLTGAKAPDLAIAAVADPGVVGPLDVPFVVSVDDPTAAPLGTVTLLRGRTGSTAWSKPGTDVYDLRRAGRPALGVGSDQSTVTATAATAKATIDAYDATGSRVWTMTRSVSVPRAADDDFTFAFALWVAFTDLEGDGGLEGGLLLVAATSSSEEVREYLIRADTGATLKDGTSGFLLGGVTRKGQDRYRWATSASGVRLTVLRGRDSATLFSRLVPGSKGVTTGSAEADRLGSTACGDVLVAGVGQSRAVAAVLASDGSPRWWLSRELDDLRPGTVTRPARPPHPRC